MNTLHGYGRACGTSFLAAGICGLLLAAPQPLFAQQTESDQVIEEVIVTGTAGGAELRKFDASFAITTMSDEDINKFSPQSTADLLKMVPGVWSESSGGVAGANVFVRGFPGGGDAPFYTLQVNGAPIFPPPTLSFLENTTLFRIDETVLRVEALRGGANPVFSNGQPGLTTNFIIREGSAETEGLVKYTTSDYDLRRFDGYLSGELADEFYYMVGGYIASSPGIRDASFNSDEGNQFTINLTKDLDNGSINFFHRQTDDHGQWYLPVALNVPGVDPEYSQLGVMNRQRQIQFANDSGDPDFTGEPETKTVDLGAGRGWDGSMSGGSVVLEITDDWELTDRFSYTAGDADTRGLVPDGGRDFSGTTADNSGKRVRRIPRTMVRLAPSVAFADGRGLLFLSLSHYGRRYANDENTIILPSYVKLDAGLQYAFSDSWSALFNVDNLSNEVGLTEGNPRTDVGASSLGQLYNARALFGRSLSFALKYNFQSG